MAKIKFLSMLLFCASSLFASAQDGKLNVLYLDGTSHEVALSQVARLKASGGTMRLEAKDGTLVATHELSSVRKIALTPSTTAIGKTLTLPKAVIRTTGYIITAEGIADGTTLELFTTDGTLVAKATAHDGKASIDCGTLKAGVYVVKAGKESIKMIKK